MMRSIAFLVTLSAYYVSLGVGKCIRSDEGLTVGTLQSVRFHSNPIALGDISAVELRIPHTYVFPAKLEHIVGCQDLICDRFKTPELEICMSMCSDEYAAETYNTAVDLFTRGADDLGALVDKLNVSFRGMLIPSQTNYAKLVTDIFDNIERRILVLENNIYHTREISVIDAISNWISVLSVSSSSILTAAALVREEMIMLSYCTETRWNSPCSSGFLHNITVTSDGGLLFTSSTVPVPTETTAFDFVPFPTLDETGKPCWLIGRFMETADGIIVSVSDIEIHEYYGSFTVEKFNPSAPRACVPCYNGMCYMDGVIYCDGDTFDVTLTVNGTNTECGCAGIMNKMVEAEQMCSNGSLIHGDYDFYIKNEDVFMYTSFVVGAANTIMLVWATYYVYRTKLSKKRDKDALSNLRINITGIYDDCE